MLAHPSLIKRPVVQWTGPTQAVTVGFDAASWPARAA
jgi:arsenate reductase-like glutaredoxin family protein